MSIADPNFESSSIVSANPSTTSAALPSPFNKTQPPPELIIQGAEAHLYKTHFLTLSTPAALKIRPAKPYRHATLDSRLTKQRVLAEARILVKLATLTGVSRPKGGRRDWSVPGVLALDWDLSRGGRGGAKGAWLLMEWIEGRTVKDVLREWDVRRRKGVTPLGLQEGGDGGEGDRELGIHEADIRMLLRRIGRAVGGMHSLGGVVHGDLTTSNIMLCPRTAAVEGNGEARGQDENGSVLHGEIVLIDFGLATQSIQDEDRAVDLYVLERAFGSTHPRQEDWFHEEALESAEGYRGSFKGASVVLKRLEDVRMRGRKRSMVG